MGSDGYFRSRTGCLYGVDAVSIGKSYSEKVTGTSIKQQATCLVWKKTRGPDVNGNDAPKNVP